MTAFTRAHFKLIVCPQTALFYDFLAILNSFLNDSQLKNQIFKCIVFHLKELLDNYNNIQFIDDLFS